MLVFLLGKEGQFEHKDLEELNSKLWEKFPDTDGSVYWDGSFQHVATTNREFAKMLETEENIEIQEKNWKPK